MKNRKAKILPGALACMIFSAVLFLNVGAAHATFISPKRVMIEDKQRAGTFNILNRSDKTMVYRFDWERYSYSPDGTKNIVGDVGTSPGYQPADPYLQFSPRQVILKPKESQTIRILVRRPATLAQGEYRSNILIQPTPLEEAERPESMPEPGVSGVLKVRTNISIPVMLRQGATSVNFNVARAALTQREGKNVVDFALVNNSTRSVYVSPKLDCQDSTGKITTAVLHTARMMVEIKNFSNILVIPPDFPLNSCTDLKMRLIGANDFEFKTNPIQTIDLR